MTKFDGKYLLGDNGVAATREISSTLLQSFLKNAETALNKKFAKYRPWMSCPNAYSYFSQYSKDLEFGEAGHIHSLETAKILSEAFYESEELPFGLVHKIKTHFKIDTKQDSLHKFKNIVDASLKFLNLSELFKLRLDFLALEFISLFQHTDKVRIDGVGRSVHWYIGGIFVGLPQKPKFYAEELAINIAHEIGHQSFMVYQNADRIINSDFNELIYSPIRKVPRPAILSFHAVVALAFMCEFMLNIIQNQALRIEQNNYFLNRLKESLFDFKLGINAINNLEYTDFGNELLTELKLFADYTEKFYATVS
ncbi:MAG: hypothetical protein V4596_09820 [Bdellovibrionota bacterium]